MNIRSVIYEVWMFGLINEIISFAYLHVYVLYLMYICNTVRNVTVIFITNDSLSMRRPNILNDLI